MGYFDDPDNVESYVEMVGGADGRALVEILPRYLAPGASVLEIGMGPGADLDLLLAHFNATGSDSSQVFLDRYRATHPDADLLRLDAVTLETDRRFDAIYSNKVLQHLTKDNAARSMQAQHAILEPGGIAFHALWLGDRLEEHHGLRFQYYTVDGFTAMTRDQFDVAEAGVYPEDEEGDSFYVVLRKRG